MPVSRQHSRPPPPPSEAPTQQVEEVEEELQYVRAEPEPAPQEVVEIVAEEAVDVDEEGAWRENIIVRFPKEQVEELVNYLIVQLLEQGYSEEEASEKAAEMLDDPASQLVMARELHKPVLVRALTSFYEQNDPSKLQFIEEQVDTYTGRTEELLQLLSKRYGGSSAGLDAVQSVVEEEREWIAVTERSTTAGGASSRRSSNVHDSGRRFLSSFFRKYDPTRVAEVDALLLMHEGDFGELRRSLCQDFASNNEALEMLLRMRVSNDDNNATGRESWLLTNARCAQRARDKRSSFSLFIEAIGFSSSFHHFVTFWLISSCAFTVLYGIQLLTNLFLSMFLPPSNGTWQSIGLMCSFFLLTFFLGSYFTQLRRVVLGWAFMTEAAYFADKDFSLVGENNPNPVPSHLKASLPPVVKRTILMLPTGSYMRREFYLGLIIVAMGVAPVFYSLISVAVKGETITHAIGEYVVWNLSCSTVLVTLIWAYGWCCATVRKWRVVRKQNSSSTPTPPWYVNPQLLQEWGLDKSTLSINITLFVVSFTILCIVYWAYTRSSSSLSVTWTVVCLIVICSIQGLRELWRSSYSKYTPHATLFLIVVFCGVGVIGAAMTSGKFAATFFVLLLLSHAMTLKRNTATDETEDESCMARALERMKLATEEEIVDIDEATPLKVGKAKAVASRHSVPSQEVDKKSSVWRMLPCSEFLRSFLAFPCYCWPIGKPVRDNYRRAWGPSKLYYPRVPKVLMSFSSLISVSLLLLFVISSVVMFSTMKTMEGTVSRPAVGVVGTKRLPICNLKWNGQRTVVDMALVSQLSYHSDVDEFTEDLVSWFGDSLEVQLPNRTSLADALSSDFGESQSRDVNFLDFTLKDVPNNHIIAIRSNIDGQLMVRDLQYWSESLLYSALKVVVPLTRYWSDDLASDFVYTSGHIPEVFGDRIGLEKVTTYINDLRQAGKVVTVVGHGVNGGYARVLASLTDSEAVTFNAPGYRWMGRRVGADNNINREVAILSEQDTFGSIDRQSGGQQTIPCDETIVDCHKLSHTICSLSTSCGDIRTVAGC